MMQAGLVETILVLGSVAGVSFGFWLSVGAIRRLSSFKLAALFTTPRARGQKLAHRIAPEQVAAVIPAHNEEAVIQRCIASLSRCIPPMQVFVASDGSTDGTVELARSLGCNVTDIRPNGGKAKALQYVIDREELCSRFKAVLFVDADAEIDPSYLANALPLFDDPDVAVVAVHVMSTWRADWFPDRRCIRDILSGASIATAGRVLSGMGKLLYTAYRVRLYRLIQGVYQYGQSSRLLDVSYIAPGVGSIYRTTALAHIDIAAPGLVIEDFNMTFEVHRKHLGRVAYTPSARCYSEDPFTFRDYFKQIGRWYLGFWQTVRRHGLRLDKFSFFLLLFTAETLLFSLLIMLLPVLVVLHAFLGVDAYAISASPLGIVEVTPYRLVAAYLIADISCTVFVAIYDRRPEILLFAPAFPVLRMVDATTYLTSLLSSLRRADDGKWVSPARQASHEPITSEEHANRCQAIGGTVVPLEQLWPRGSES
jgi:biofilm PGA synthesis N-glycosyltransferase PgaC